MTLTLTIWQITSFLVLFILSALIMWGAGEDYKKGDKNAPMYGVIGVSVFVVVWALGYASGTC